jgi:cytochrome b561
MTKPVLISTSPAALNDVEKSAAPAFERYTRLAVALHWIVAILILGSYSSMYTRLWFTQKATWANVTALEIHIAFGISIGVFVALRLAWRLANRPPALPAGPKLQLAAAKATHRLLYVMIVVMPLSGYGATTRLPAYLSLIPGFRNSALYNWLVSDLLGISWSAWVKSLYFIHHVSGAYLLWPLILLHVAAAFYHQFGKRDDGMRRMWF